MSRQPKALATSGVRWGLSCEVEDEASMGVLLGYMKLFGASAIGFDPIGGKVKRRNPADAAAGRKGGRPKGIRNHSRRPLMTEAQAVIEGYGPNHEFATADFNLSMERWSQAARSRALMLLCKAKAIKRVRNGLYKTASHLKIVKTEKAA